MIAGLISVRYWGLWGVLIATGSAISFKALLIYLLATRHIKLSWDWKYYAKVVGASAIMGAVVYFLSDLVDNVMVMLLLVLAGSIIYLVVILAERPFSTQDLNLINHILGRNIFPLRKQKKSI
ncbi:MAG: polysaccharide biosynthesis C-terminal domain-containing protein [Chloroflexi bacterium]|nr:polysaccharide biosynthesis C-terminal domain-containing protein [Chloroflexota bacterium]